MHILRFVFVLFALTLAGGCHLFDAPASPKTMPCGGQGRSCGNGLCCADTQVCGAAGTACPEGTCCYVGTAGVGRALVPTPAQDAALAKAVRALVAAETASATPVPTTPAPVPTSTVPIPPPAPSPLGARFDTQTLAALAQLDASAPKSRDEFVFATSTPTDRPYYDVPLALFTMFARTGTAVYRTDALRESDLYRKSITWDATHKFAFVGDPLWKPGVQLIDPAVLRRLYVEGQVADHKLTGNPDARAIALGLGASIIAALPMLSAPRSSGRPALIETTERNMAFALLGLTAAAKLDAATFLPHVTAVLARAVAWNERSPSGCFEHDLAAHDPAECAAGRGCSPFMGTLLAEAMYKAHAIAPNPKVPAALARYASWLSRPESQTIDGRGWRYLVGCTDEGDGPVGANEGYAVQWTEDLNALVVGGLAYGAALSPTDASRFFAVGDKMASLALDTYWARKSPKHFGQDVRGLAPFFSVRSGQKAW